MRRSTFLLACALVFINTVLSAQQSFTLDQAVQYALDQSLSIKRSQINITDADEQIIERRATGIPQLSLGVDYNYFIDIPTQILPDFLSPAVYGVLFQEGLLEPRPISTDGTTPAQFGTKHNLTAGLNLRTMIFDGSYFVGLKAARRYRAYVQQDLVRVRTEVRQQVIDAYLPALLIQENLRILDRNIENLSQLLFETKAQYREGFVEQLDVDRLELSLANLRTERDNLERQREVVLNVLKYVMGYPLNQPIEISGDIESVYVDAAEADLLDPINYERRPEYKVASIGVELNELNVDLFRSTYLPTLNAFGSYQQSMFANKLSEGQWFPTTVVGLNLNVPIFDGLNKKAKIQRARLDLELAQNQRTELQRVIDMEVLNARINYLNAQERMRSQQKNMALAERIYQTTQVKYREGVGSSLEIVQAEQSLYQTQQNYQQALYDLLTAKTALDKALGN